MGVSCWEVIGGGSVEVLDYGLWIEGEMLSEKDELERITE